MGCAASQSAPGPAGNLLVDGFMRYTSGTQGWQRVKIRSGRKELHIETYPADEPLGTWRGNVTLDGVTLDDVLSYVKYKLGPDNFELLANDEDEWIFRELFDFKEAADGKHSHKYVGDHRGETAERMEGGMAVMDPRKTALSRSEIRQNVSRTLDSPKSMPISTIAEGDVPPLGLGSKDDDSGSSSDEEDVHPARETETSEPINDIAGALENGEGSSRNTTWHARLFSSKSGTINGTAGSVSARTSKTKETEFPAPREIIFKRQDFGLGTSKAVVIAQSIKYNKQKNMIGAKRCTAHMIGALIEEFVERKRPRVKLTFLCSIDPELAEWEKKLATPDALSVLGGKQRVESFLLDCLQFFSVADNKLIQRFRYTASAGPGEMDWEDVERDKNELQLGTNVQHPKHGHGVVQSFDMKGRVRVVYDSKEIVDHPPEEKDDLRVAVIIGTRVQHPERGYGTVKAFDETGRIHVKFDNGEMHRYKQEAWKKKMHLVKLMGIGGALGTVKLSWRPIENVREGMGRVKFAVGVSTEAVLEYLLEANSTHTEEEQKSGMIIERRVVQVISGHERIIYEHRRMPQPLNPRDFVFKEIWEEVAPKTYAVVYQSVVRPDIPEKPNCVRGEYILSGWLLEPLYLDEEAYDGEDHVCRITFQMCVDVKGFIAPEAVDAVRSAQLLGALTDCRAYFWNQSQQKANKKLKQSRQSKRMDALNVDANTSGSMKKIASVLKMQ